MIRRYIRFAIRVALLLVLSLGALISVALWRLSNGPVQVDFLTPYLERAFAGSPSGDTVKIQNTIVAWERESHRIDLRARGVTVLDRDNRKFAVFPTLRVALSLRALLHGMVAPTTVEVEGVRVYAIRTAEGVFQLGAARRNALAKNAQQADVVVSVIRHLLAEYDPSQPHFYFKTFRVIDGGFMVEDRRLGTTWKASMPTLELRRDATGLTGHASAKLALADSVARFAAHFAYDKSSTKLALTGSFSGLRPSVLAAVIPDLKHLAGLALPLGGSVKLSCDQTGKMRAADVRLVSGPGHISHPNLLPTPLPVSELEASGHLSEMGKRLVLDSATVVFGTSAAPGPVLHLHGGVNGFGNDGMTVKAHAKVDNLRTDDLRRYWPPGLAKKARQWAVKNIRKGAVTKAGMRLEMELPGSEPNQANLRRLAGTLQYRDLAVDYLRPLPPVTGITGNATFDQKGLHFKVKRARSAGLNVSAAKVDITGLDNDREAIAIALDVDGPIPAALTLLDHPRLDLISHLAIDPTHTGGQATVQTSLSFPLKKDLDLQDVDIQAQAALKNASIQDLWHGEDMTNGNLRLSADKNRMTLKGSMELAAVPLTLDWREGFSPQSNWGQEIRVDIPKLGNAGRGRLGLNTKAFVDGPLSAAIVAKLEHDGPGVVNAEIDLAQTRLAVPSLGWTKAQNKPGTARFTLRLSPDRMVKSGDFSIHADTLQAQGNGHFDTAGTTIERLDLSSLALGKSRLSDISVRRLDDAFAISIGAGVLDAEPLLHSNAQARRQGTALAFSLSAPMLERVYVAKDRYLEDVRIRLDHTSTAWELIEVSAKVPPFPSGQRQSDKPPAPEPNHFTMRYGPAGTDKYLLSIDANDTGATLRALNIRDTVRGGRLEIEGNTDAPDGPLHGKITLQDFALIDAPLMARLLTAASLTGLLDLLKGDGIHFTELEADVALKDGVLTVEWMRAHSSALGLTAKGDMNLGAEQMRLNGTVIPLYTLNSAVGKIPLIGEWVVGGKGEGIVGVNYGIRGKFANPRVAVNPISALTPGVLRKVFELGKEKDKEKK